MTMKPRIGSVLAGCFLCGVGIMLGSSAQGQTVLINDTFDSSFAPTRLDDPNDSLDTDWWAVGPVMDPSQHLYLIDDFAGIASGNALAIATDNDYGSRIWANFPGYDSENPASDNVRLRATGDWLQATFDVRITSMGDAANRHFRFGFYSKDTLDAETETPDQDRVDHDGYYLREADGYLVMLGTGESWTPTFPDNSIRVRRETDGATAILSASGDDQGNFNAPKGTCELDTDAHTIRLKLERTDTGSSACGVKVTLWVDDMTTPLAEHIDDGTLVFEDASDPYGCLWSFDSFCIGNNSGGSSDASGPINWLLDNVVIEASVTPPSGVPGDTDNDGDVDEADAATVAANWGDTVTPGDETLGDFNGDGVVDIRDAAILAANWGNGTEESLEGVPEPTTPVLLLAMLVGLMKRRCGGRGTAAMPR